MFNDLFPAAISLSLSLLLSFSLVVFYLKQCDANLGPTWSQLGPIRISEGTSISLSLSDRCFLLEAV